VRVRINVGDDVPIFDEGENRHTNILEVKIKVPSPRKKVAAVE
jgi:hypothetical protein